MLTAGQVQNSSVANVAGVNVADPQFFQLVSDACEQLMDIGSWWGTVQAIIGCVYDDCVVWPLKVDAVLGMEICRQPVALANHWHQFVPINDHHREWSVNWNRGNRPHITFNGTTPLFFLPTPANPMLLGFTCDNAADNGKFVTVYGTDINGHELFATRPDGSSQLGVQLTLATPSVQMPVALQTVSAITKDITAGTVRAWSITPVTGALVSVGTFRAGDTSPEFLYSRLAAYNNTRSISALVKLGFVPVTQPSDILPLDCLDAIKCQVQSIKARDSGDPEKSLFYEKMAIRRLNMQMRTRFPMEQFILAFNPFGSDTLDRQKIGRLI